jgi:hypothetical protein
LDGILRAKWFSADLRVALFFLIYVACGLYLWLLGIAVFGGCENRRSLFHAPWLGYGVLIGCLQIVHLVWALSPPVAWAFLLLTCLCAAGIVIIRPRKEAPKGVGSRRLSVPVQLTLLLAPAVAAFFPAFNTTTQAIVHYDLGYYYLQTIRWVTSFPIVPGLGNLLLNLAFNQSPFLVAALFDSLGPHLWGYSLLGGVLPWLGLTLSGFALLQGLCALLELRRPLEPIEKAYLISLPAWIYTLLTVNISSNSPDIASACLQIHLYLCFASFLAETEEKTRWSAFGTLLVLAALSLSIKLSSAFLVATISALAVAVMIVRVGPAIIAHKQILLAVLAAAAIFLPWVLRGIVVSGYPFFPSSTLGGPFAWRIPDSAVSHFYNITVYWARQPYYDLEKVRTGFAWVPEWFQRNWQLKDQFEKPLILCSVWTLLLALLAWKWKDLRKNVIRLSLMILPVLVSLLIWFFTAPEPRYLGSITWLLPLAVPLCLISEASPLSRAFIGVSLCVNYAALGSLRYNTQWAWKRRASGFPEIRQVELKEKINPAGIHLYYPKAGDQVFDAPLPATRESRPKLRLLDERKGISGGFRDSRIDDSGRQIEEAEH